MSMTYREMARAIGEKCEREDCRLLMPADYNLAQGMLNTSLSIEIYDKHGNKVVPPPPPQVSHIPCKSCAVVWYVTEPHEGHSIDRRGG